MRIEIEISREELSEALLHTLRQWLEGAPAATEVVVRIRQTDVVPPPTEPNAWPSGTPVPDVVWPVPDTFAHLNPQPIGQVPGVQPQSMRNYTAPDLAALQAEQDELMGLG